MARADSDEVGDVDDAHDAILDAHDAEHNSDGELQPLHDGGDSSRLDPRGH